MRFRNVKRVDRHVLVTGDISNAMMVVIMRGDIGAMAVCERLFAVVRDLFHFVFGVGCIAIGVL